MLTVRKMATRAIYNRHEILNKQSEATVYLYGDIGGWFGMDHLEWVKDFNQIKADTIHLRIDSSGGDIFAARAMKTAVMQHKAKVIAHIDGLAASAASFFAMGADEIEIVEGGFFMIHNALSFLDIFGYFNADDLNKLLEDIGKEKDLHIKINESIANDYIKRTGKSEEEVLEWMNAETWFTAKEALDNNFADRIYDGELVEGNYDLSVFAKTPDVLKARNQEVSKRTIERALRDVGLSNKEAKEILAKGYDDESLWDVDNVDVKSKPDATNQRDVGSIKENQRDVDNPKPKKKDLTTELLNKAKLITI